MENGLEYEMEYRYLLVKDHTQEGTVHMKSAIVTNEAQFPEFIHEKIDSGASCANHLRQHLLGNFGAHLLRFGFAAIAREQQESPRQPFLAGVKELIDQIFLDSDVPRKDVSHEAVGERLFSVEHAHHLVFFNDQYG
jgi:hypothetical protein